MSTRNRGQPRSNRNRAPVAERNVEEDRRRVAEDEMKLAEDKKKLEQDTKMWKALTKEQEEAAEISFKATTERGFDTDEAKKILLTEAFFSRVVTYLTLSDVVSVSKVSELFKETIARYGTLYAITGQFQRVSDSVVEFGEETDPVTRTTKPVMRVTTQSDMEPYVPAGPGGNNAPEPAKTVWILKFCATPNTDPKKKEEVVYGVNKNEINASWNGDKTHTGTLIKLTNGEKKDRGISELTDAYHLNISTVMATGQVHQDIGVMAPDSEGNLYYKGVSIVSDGEVGPVKIGMTYVVEGKVKKQITPERVMKSKSKSPEEEEDRPRFVPGPTTSTATRRSPSPVRSAGSGRSASPAQRRSASRSPSPTPTRSMGSAARRFNRQ